MREVTSAPALEMVELKTFEFDAEVAGGPGLTAFDSAVNAPDPPWIAAPSPSVPRSPSYATTPTVEVTGPDSGVWNPLSGIVTVPLPVTVCIPSNTDRLRLGAAGSP